MVNSYWCEEFLIVVFFKGAIGEEFYFNPTNSPHSSPPPQLTINR
jgi:hypothetical protein